MLTAKQIEERELERKRKYQEFKAKQKVVFLLLSSGIYILAVPPPLEKFKNRRI